VIPRTFSLARLLLAITAFCILCGLAVNFPAETMMFIAVPSMFVLPPALCVLLGRLSRRPEATFVASMVGMFLGYVVDFLLARIFLPLWQPITSLDALGLPAADSPLAPLGLTVLVCAVGAIPPLLGALLGGGTALLIHLNCPSSTHDDSLNQETEVQNLRRR
jgi:hypothetical protein